jgi:hypothetical protein
MGEGQEACEEGSPVTASSSDWIQRPSAWVINERGGMGDFLPNELVDDFH